jgi:chromosome segregation ATPase
MALSKTLLRVTVIGGLATGGLVLLAGPQRVGMLFDQARQTVSAAIDDQIDDPVALRNQLRELEKQYPEKIAKVEGELAELNREMKALERERAVSSRVVELAEADLDELSGLLEDAQAARAESPRAIIKVHWSGTPLNYDDALTRAANIRSTYNTYATRVVEADKTVDVLMQQKNRLTELLGELRDEHNSFKAQIAQLDGQIEAIARNERLIDMVEEREKAIAQLDRHESHSLGHIQSKLEKTRAEQEARLAAILNPSEAEDYAREAEEMLNREQAAKELFEATMSAPTPSALGDRIDITPDAEGDADSSGPVASSASSRDVVDID